MDPVLLLLFLDVDGVLNSANWIRKRPSKDEWAKLHNVSPEIYDHDRYTWGLRSIDPDAVRLLDEIVTVTGARVVVSSSWRTMYPLNRLQWMLRHYGFDHDLLGATPDGFDMRARDGLGQHVSRGEEITAWLKLLPPTLRVRWVVLDDELVEGHESQLVQTDFNHGLIPAYKTRIYEILGVLAETP